MHFAKQKSPIPHGLVVRIRAFHARGRGSIPCGGDNKIGNSKTLINKLLFHPWVIKLTYGDIRERLNDCWNRQRTLWKDGNLQSVTPTNT